MWILSCSGKAVFHNDKGRGGHELWCRDKSEGMREDGVKIA